MGVATAPRRPPARRRAATGTVTASTDGSDMAVDPQPTRDRAATDATRPAPARDAR